MAFDKPAPSPGRPPAPGPQPPHDQPPAQERASAADDGRGPQARGRTASPGNPSPIDRALLAPPILGRAAAQGTMLPASRSAPSPNAHPVGRATPHGNTISIGRATPPAGTERPEMTPAHNAGPAGDHGMDNPERVDSASDNDPADARKRDDDAEPPRREPGLQLQPMVHVEDMAASIAFYEHLGAEIVHGDRDADWVLLQLGTTQIGLLAHPPDLEDGEGTVELNFAAAMPLDELEAQLRRDGVTIVEVAGHTDFGVQLRIRTTDGLLIKISQLEPDLGRWEGQQTPIPVQSVAQRPTF